MISKVKYLYCLLVGKRQSLQIVREIIRYCLSSQHLGFLWYDCLGRDLNFCGQFHPLIHGSKMSNISCCEDCKLSLSLKRSPPSQLPVWPSFCPPARAWSGLRRLREMLGRRALLLRGHVSRFRSSGASAQRRQEASRAVRAVTGLALLRASVQGQGRGCQLTAYIFSTLLLDTADSLSQGRGNQPSDFFWQACLF